METNYYLFPTMRDCEGKTYYNVIDLSEGVCLDELVVDSKGVILGSAERLAMYEDLWNYYKQSSEYKCLYFDIPEKLADIITLYKNILSGSVILRNLKKLDIKGYKDGIERCYKYIEHCLKWLDTTDFFNAPASTRYHDSYRGGLVNHTINVVHNLIDLWKLEKFNKVDIGSAILCACVHDWCKIGLYESYMRNVKDENTGRWNSVESYRTKEKTLINLGHGVSSAFLANRFFNLSILEFESVRWHMGHWRVSNDEVNELQSCNENNPLVHMLQFADQLSIVNY